MSYDMLVSCAWIMVCFCHIIFMNYTMLVLYVMSCHVYELRYACVVQGVCTIILWYACHMVYIRYACDTSHV